MSEVIEQALFRNEYDALNFAFGMEFASCYPAQTFERVQTFNAWTDLSQLDRHAQAAFIQGMTKRALTPPELAVIRARHAHGLTKRKGIEGLSEQVRGVVKNEGECLDMIVGSLYVESCGLRTLASHYGVGLRSVEDDRMMIRGHINALEKMAYPRVRQKLKEYQGLID